MKDWYKLTTQETLNNLNTTDKGLSTAESTIRLSTYGDNTLKDSKKESVLTIFFKQFADLMVIILIIAATISMFTGDIESTIVIISVLILNALLGTIQHVKAAKSLDALKSLSSPAARVIRDGIRQETDSRYIVPGDIVILEAGDIVPADGRIIESYSLQVNESALTGESTNVEKVNNIINIECPLADRTNMVYSGSLVTYGRAVAAITETGMNTEVGKIAELMNSAKSRKTPLQVSLDQFSQKLAACIMIICFIVFALSVYRGNAILDAVLFAVALAVAAIPEALGSIVTIVQAMGTQKMSKEMAIIKNLSAVESLGCVSVICSDKTGTLTQNKMTVQDIFIDGKVITPSQLDISCQLHRYLIYDAVLANDSSIVDGKGIGDPTEYALLEMYHNITDINNDCELSITEDTMRDILTRKEELPFDSDRKLMSTKHIIHGISTIFTKGAPDVLLERCTSILLSDGIHEMSDLFKNQIINQNTSFSEKGLRVLAFAYKESDEGLTSDSEQGLTFLGLISEMDPPRKESIQAVADARKAGIRTVMITGDHKITATSIAKSIGIWNDGDIALTGQELDKMSDNELDDNIEKISVYARVSPENKIRIVDAWQRKGRIVAMTGDGVNDAPALKKSDIGVAMGITGTEVSKDAASMILADDNFATIVNAVANGRTVYNNIKNAILYLLSGNFAAILVVIYSSLMALPVPFQAVQLLFINLVTDSLPALAIGMEPGSKDVLLQKPRNPKKGIMDKSFAALMTSQGLLIAICVTIAFTIGLTSNPTTACTMAFSTLTLARLLHGFNCRGSHSLIRLGFKNNMYSLGAFILGLILVAAVLFVPFVQKMFSVIALPAYDYMIIGILALIPTILIQAFKIIHENIVS